MTKKIQSLLLIIGCSLALNSRATVYYWDPEGTAAESAASFTGTWDGTTLQWATTSAQTASQVAWVSGDAADFCAGGTTVSTAFTVTLNSTLTIGGIFNGSLSTPGSLVTISGTGSLSLASGADAFATGGVGTTTIAVPMIGPGQVALEAGGKIFFNGTNTYSGGTSIGYVGLTAFTGTANFNNGSSFGTGAMTMTTAGANCTLQVEGTAPITLANSWVAAAINMNIVANPAGLTLTGPWNLAATPAIGAGGTGDLITISGVMSGVGGFTKYGASTIVLSGPNTYTGLTTISNGVLSITADNNLGAAPSTAAISLDLAGGTLNASNTFTLSTKRQTILGANSSISVSTGKTLSYGGPITGPFALAKTGAGTLALSGNNGYTGTTTISAGILEADSGGGSSVGANTLTISASGTLSGTGIVSGLVTGTGTLAPGTPAGPGMLTLGNGLNMSGGATFAWTLATNSTTTGFSSVTLNGGNLTLNGSSKLSVNFTGSATSPNTNDAFWLTQEEWTVAALNGSSANPSGSKFTTILNGAYATGNFTCATNVIGSEVLLYQPNFPVFDTLYDSGQGFFGGENLILTNFSGLNLFVWSSTDATLSVSNWTLVGQMGEQSLAPGQPGYSRYSINANPTVSPTFYIAGNTNSGQYILPTAPTAILTTSDFMNFTVYNTNVGISSAGVLALLPAQPTILPGSIFANGQFQLEFNAALNQAYTVQGSTDLFTWTNVLTGTVSNVPTTVIDVGASNYDSQYYRVVLPVTFP